jgi:hypothetical protein
MGVLTLSQPRIDNLRRFRRNTWRAIALCTALRVADAAFGLNLIEHTEPVAAQEAPACPLSQEIRS